MFLTTVRINDEDGRGGRIRICIVLSFTVHFYGSLLSTVHVLRRIVDLNFPLHRIIFEILERNLANISPIFSVLSV